jgi:hypothetical protein
MDIEDKIKEVSDYFLNKFLTGDFKFVSADNYNAHVIVDDKYKFIFWIGNEIKDHFEVNHYNDNDIISNRVQFETEENRLKVWGYIKDDVDNYRKKEIIAKKEAELELLKKDLEKLGSIA